MCHRITLVMSFVACLFSTRLYLCMRVSERERERVRLTPSISFCSHRITSEMTSTKDVKAKKMFDRCVIVKPHWRQEERLRLFPFPTHILLLFRFLLLLLLLLFLVDSVFLHFYFYFFSFASSFNRTSAHIYMKISYMNSKHTNFNNQWQVPCIYFTFRLISINNNIITSLTCCINHFLSSCTRHISRCLASHHYRQSHLYCLRQHILYHRHLFHLYQRHHIRVHLL
jgi:hypothetical protein